MSHVVVFLFSLYRYMTQISLGIIDDHPAIASGLAAELQATGLYSVLFNITEKDLLLSQLNRGFPDVLLMDIVMPGANGIEVFKAVLKVYPAIKILAYSGLSSPLLIDLLIKSGVKGYVNKASKIEELKFALSAVVQGKIYLPEPYRYLLKKDMREEANDEISSRELEVLKLISEGKKTHEIAEQLFISVNTVESHRKHLFQKLNVTNIAALIMEAINMGYVK